MPISLPRLDDRTFEQLVAEARALIPRYTPDWTDHNVHDPGITLLELFAWLVELDLYRLDRISGATYRNFLRLLGIEPRPLHAAEVRLTFSLKSPGTMLSLPKGLQAGDGASGLTFQTAQAINISPATLRSILAGPVGSLIDCFEANDHPGKRFFPFGPAPAVDNALYLGFDQPLLGLNQPLGDAPPQISLYVWVGQAEADRLARKRLIAEQEAAIVEASEDTESGPTQRIPNWKQHYSTATVWEYYAGSDPWEPLTGVVDETRGLTLSGPVRFIASKDQQKGGTTIKALDHRYFFIRCRLKSGAYESPPQISHIALNVVKARQAVDVAEPKPFRSTGNAGQVVPLLHKPVVPGSTQVEVTLNGKSDGTWREALYWDRAGPHDRIYVLSPETGEITFGDGRHGRVPPADAQITITYQVGGGLAGNVAAGALRHCLDNSALIANWEAIKETVSISQPFPALGGAEAESLADTKARAVQSLASIKRAITLGDFETLALATPGVPVARAFALVDYDPELPYLPTLGAVTVVVVPDGPGAQPTPSPEMLRAIACYLERRRLVTTEVHVIAPRYTAVRVQARLTVEPGVTEAQMAGKARAALDAFFHPLQGGADGTGWPVGRDVYRSEVMALLNSLPGVLYVDQVTLQREDKPAGRCGNIGICRHALVASGPHQITVLKRSG
ncbi:MAG: putative baseplate assembly protein [Desulfobaccales bacterium]